MKINCPRCGKENPAENRFCLGCGSDIHARPMGPPGMARPGAGATLGPPRMQQPQPPPMLGQARPTYQNQPPPMGGGPNNMGPPNLGGPTMGPPRMPGPPPLGGPSGGPGMGGPMGPPPMGGPMGPPLMGGPMPPLGGMGQGPMGPPPMGYGPMGPPPTGQGPMGPPPMGQGPMGPPPMGQGPMGPPPMGQGPMGPPMNRGTVGPGSMGPPPMMGPQRSGLRPPTVPPGMRPPTVPPVAAPAEVVRASVTDRPRLMVVNLDGVEQGEVPLHPGDNLIGREAGGLLAEDGLLSSRHAMISVDPSGATVRDAGSRNGVYVRIPKQQAIPLQDGDQFCFGRIILRYEARNTGPLPGEEGPAPLPEGDAIGQLSLVVGRDVDKTLFPVAIPRTGVTLGRSRSDVRFPGDGWVSGVHCQVVEVDGRPSLADLGSSNGTYLRIRGVHRLEDHDALLMGQRIFHLHVPGA